MNSSNPAERLRQSLHSKVLWLGGKWRRAALVELESRLEEPEMLQVLVDAVEHFDPEIQTRVRDILRKTQSAGVRDRLCRLAREKPKGPIAALCAEAGHRPSMPSDEVDYLVETEQVANLAQRAEEPVFLRALVGAMELSSVSNRKFVRGWLAKTSSPRVHDELCAMAIGAPDKPVATVCVEAGYYPSDPRRHIEFFVATRQAEQLEKRIDDPDFLRALVLAMEHSSPKAREFIRNSLAKTKSMRARDELCEIARAAPDGAIAKLCVEAGHQPSASERQLEFLLATRQTVKLEQRSVASDFLRALLAAAGNSDASTRDFIHHLLSATTNSQVRDQLCLMAMQEPAGNIGALCIKAGHRPSDPRNEVLFLDATGQMSELAPRIEDRPFLEALVAHVENLRPEFQAATRALFMRTKSPIVRDYLCARTLQHPESMVARVCREADHRPSRRDQDAVYLLLTGQAERYFRDEEFGLDNFVALRAAHDSADADTRSRVMRVVDKSDIRWLNFVTKLKKLEDCTDREIQLSVQTALQSQDWPRLFRAVLELPGKFSVPLLQKLQEVDWRPDAPPLQALYRELLGAGETDQAIGSTIASDDAPVFERWLSQGRSAELTGLSALELRRRMEASNPPQSISLVAALAAKSELEAATIRAISENEHWLIRLAGIVTGITKDPESGEADHVFWLNHVPVASKVLDCWPGKATAADLARLRSLPPEAYQGKLGAVRKVVHRVIAYRVQATDFVPLVVRVGDDTAVLEDVPQ